MEASSGIGVVLHAVGPVLRLAPVGTGGVASMIGQGMMWGAGSGIGHRVTDSIMGPRTIAYESAQNNEEGASSSNGTVVDARTKPCAGPMELFGKCLEQNTDNVAQCQAFADLLTSCKRDL